MRNDYWPGLASLGRQTTYAEIHPMDLGNLDDTFDQIVRRIGNLSRAGMLRFVILQSLNRQQARLQRTRRALLGVPEFGKTKAIPYGVVMHPDWIGALRREFSLEDGRAQGVLSSLAGILVIEDPRQPRHLMTFIDCVGRPIETEQIGVPHDASPSA